MLVSNPYDGERRAGTVGLPLPGVEVRLGRGASGEIEVRGPERLRRLLATGPRPTREAFTPTAGSAPATSATIDDDGYLRIVGRAKELIITGGYNVYPREVEDVLLRAIPPSTEASPWSATPSAEWGETVVAYVVGTGDTAAVQAWAETQLAAFKRPRAYHWVEALPRNALGKLQKHLL